MILPTDLIDTMFQATAAIPVAIAGSPEPAHASAAKSGDAAMGPLGKAMISAFIVLALINGNMPANTQFALVIGVAAYFFFKKEAHA
jgi:hypothetical protein